jgi:hypothetical protein
MNRKIPEKNSRIRWQERCRDKEVGKMNEKLDIQDLIRRARKLAALAKKATPGPWRAAQAKSGPFKLSPWWYVVGLPVDGPSTGGDYYSEADAKLVAAAPDMAHLLKQMADELKAVLG